MLTFIPLGDDNSDRRIRPLVNYALIGLNVLVFLFLQGLGENYRLLSIVGTLAVFMVGGGIMAYGMPPLQGFMQLQEERPARWPGMAGTLQPLVATLAETVFGVLAGALALAGTKLFS